MLIAPFEPTDRAACLEVFESNVPRYFLPSERAEFEAFLDALPGPYFVVRDDRSPVVGCGGFALSGDGRIADLCWGMVRQDRHGRGLGTALTRHRLEQALAHPGVEAVHIETSQLTEAFYRALGFERLSVERDAYGPGLDRCAMRLRAERRA